MRPKSAHGFWQLYAIVLATVSIATLGNCVWLFYQSVGGRARGTGLYYPVHLALTRLGIYTSRHLPPAISSYWEFDSWIRFFNFAFVAIAANLVLASLMAAILAPVWLVLFRHREDGTNQHGVASFVASVFFWPPHAPLFGLSGRILGTKSWGTLVALLAALLLLAALWAVLQWVTGFTHLDRRPIAADRAHGPDRRDLRGRRKWDLQDPHPAGGSAPGWEFWANLFVIGLALGAVYALIALGYSLVYGILRMINFAHGEVFMFGAFGSFFFARAYAASGFMNSQPMVRWRSCSCPPSAARAGSRFCSSGSATARCGTRPRLVPLITAIGASLLLQNTAQGFFGVADRGYPRPAFLEGNVTIAGVSFDKIDPVVIVTSIVVMVALELFVKRTRTGKSMRAVAQDREIASLMGIDVDRVVVITFVIGGMLAGIAGVLYSLSSARWVRRWASCPVLLRSRRPFSGGSAASRELRSAA